MDIKKLESIVKSGVIPKAPRPFAGAGLIVSRNPNRNHFEGDVFVLTEHVAEISWVIKQLANIYSKNIDFENKYYFYPALGESALAAINKNKNLSEICRLMIMTAKGFWS